MPFTILIDILGAIHRPTCLPGMVMHTEVMADQVINVGPHDLSNRALFFFRFSDQIVIERVEKIVPVQFVRTGVALPVILAIG